MEKIGLVICSTWNIDSEHHCLEEKKTPMENWSKIKGDLLKWGMSEN